MTGLYIHIPFCQSRCLYCGFYSTTQLNLRQRYTDALCKEMSLRNSQDLSTIYLGGGTPSQLSISQLQKIFESIYIYNKVENNSEITIECNPDDINTELIRAYHAMGINRISIGVQTFNDKRLKFLNRRHTSEQVYKAIEILRKFDFNNISIDLMYGFPEESLLDWKNDIKKAVELEVEHISSYCLTYEEGTPLFNLLENHQIKEIDEEHERLMYDTLIDTLEAAGYEHYEISNFAKPSFRSRHNSSYWTGKPYIGIGAAAHSYNIKSRSWNVSDINLYIKEIELGRRPFEEEILDDDTHYNDIITTSLRTRDGIRLNSLSKKHRLYCLQNAKRFLDSGLLEIKTIPCNHPQKNIENWGEQILCLTRQGLFVSDMIMSELIYLP